MGVLRQLMNVIIEFLFKLKNIMFVKIKNKLMEYLRNSLNSEKENIFIKKINKCDFQLVFLN